MLVPFYTLVDANTSHVVCRGRRLMSCFTGLQQLLKPVLHNKKSLYSSILLMCCLTALAVDMLQKKED